MAVRVWWFVGGIMSLPVMAACGSSDTSTSADAGAAAETSWLDSGAPPTNDAAMGTSIAGMVNGTAFNDASTALWIGMPDSPTTEVVYVFSNPVSCAVLVAPVWDARLPMDTSVLEMKTLGTTTMAYPVASTANPSTGQAVVNYTLSKTVIPSVETASGGGTVTLATINPTTLITGLFDLTFSNGDTLRGSFNAVYCPGGVEP
jgi:hypothetical protein